MKLGETTLKVLKAIRKDPRISYRELMERCGLASTSVVYYHIGKLERAGYVTKRPGSRGLYIGDRSRGRTGGNRVVRNPEAKEKLLAAITAHPDWTQAQITQATGVTNVTYYMKKLAAEGRIKIQPMSRAFRRRMKTRKSNAERNGDVPLRRMSKAEQAARIEMVVAKAKSGKCEVESAKWTSGSRDVVRELPGRIMKSIKCRRIG